MSPSCWFADRAIFPFVAAAPRVPGRKLYLDIGTEEGEAMVADARRLRDQLLEQGYQVGQELLYLEEEGTMHTESAWAYRLQVALRFLLPRATS